MDWFSNVYVLEENKKSAKGVTKAAQKRLTHEGFKDTLLNNKVVRLVNTRIQSKGHEVQTIQINKTSLSGFDNKRYICNDKITTKPFGHYSLTDDIFLREIEQDPDWGNEVLENDDTRRSEVSEAEEEFVAFPEGGYNTEFIYPDMGFHQRSYSPSELEDVVDLTNLSNDEEESDAEQQPSNPFILTEAEVEESESDTPRPKRRRAIIMESDSD